MLTAYSRVTVVATDRTVDLALPSALPVAELMPQLLRFVAPEGDGQPDTWTLAKVGGNSVGLAQTLADAGVLDGDVLELRTRTEEIGPAVVEDVRDAVEDSVDAAGGVWSHATTGSFAVRFGSGVLALIAVAALAAGPLHQAWLAKLADPLPGIVVVAALLAATWWADRYARPIDVRYAAGAAMLWALAAGSGVDGLPHQHGVRLMVGVVAAAVVAGIARSLSGYATGHVAAGVAMAGAALLASVIEIGFGHDSQAWRIVPVLALLATGVLPRVSLSVGGLASADYRVRYVGRLSHETLRARYQTSNALLVGGVVGLSVAVGWGAVVLSLAPGAWDRALGLGLGAALVLRSRAFSRTQHMAPLRVAGLVVWVVAGLRLAHDNSGLATALAPVAAVVLLVWIALASMPMSQITSARVKRGLNVVEFLVVVETIVVMCGALGVFSKIGGIF